MNRIKYEQYHGAAGYDAVARRKIKELEKKVGGGGIAVVKISAALVDGQMAMTADKTFDAIRADTESGTLHVAMIVTPIGGAFVYQQNSASNEYCTFTRLIGQTSSELMYEEMHIQPDNSIFVNAYTFAATKLQ